MDIPQPLLDNYDVRTGLRFDQRPRVRYALAMRAAGMLLLVAVGLVVPFH